MQGAIPRRVCHADSHAPPRRVLFIGNDIEIVILQAGSQVKVGVNASRSVEIVRTELLSAAELEEIDD